MADVVQKASKRKTLSKGEKRCLLSVATSEDEFVPAADGFLGQKTQPLTNDVCLQVRACVRACVRVRGR